MRNKGAIKIRVQPLEWFKKNCYKDKENDWWKNKEDAEIFFKNMRVADIEKYEKFLFFGMPDRKNFGNVVDADVLEKENWEWAVQEYITIEDYPEYYL